MTKHLCTECYGGHVDDARAKHLIRNNLRMTCMQCGEKLAKDRAKSFTVAIPYGKGAYQYIHNPKDLFTTNPKRTT